MSKIASVVASKRNCFRYSGKGRQQEMNPILTKISLQNQF